MRYLLIVMAIFFLSGCVKKVYVPVVSTRYEEIPNDLIKDDISLPKPPDRESFVNSGPIERGSMLTSTVMDLYSTIRLYKLKLKHISDYNKELKDLNDKSLKELEDKNE
jgi:PBP1b-binding outer membrane lipoprotein LpoB